MQISASTRVLMAAVQRRYGPQAAIHLKKSRHSNPLPQVPSSLASCSTQVSANVLPQNKILRNGAPPGHLAGVWAQAKVERCTTLGVACSPQPTAMCRDKRTGYRQPQGQTVVLGREKRLEHLLKLTLSNADATVGYGYPQHPFGIYGGVDSQWACRGGNPAHCLACIHH